MAARDPELERFKTLDLVAFAEAHGYSVETRRQNGTLAELRHTDGERVDITQDEDGHHVFNSWHHEASGSIIDFVQHIHPGANLGRVRQILRQWLAGTSPIPTAHPPAKRKEPRPFDRGDLRARWQALTPYRSGYLEARGLEAATVAAIADRIRTDDRRNVAFRHDDLDGLTGWELKNRAFTGFCDGGRKALFAARLGISPKDAPPRVVIAESALDALSFWQLDPTPALLVSFAGGMSPAQKDLLRHVLTKYPEAEILTATDADDQGDAYAAALAAIRPDAIRARPPTGKDWNDTLKTHQKATEAHETTAPLLPHQTPHQNAPAATPEAKTEAIENHRPCPEYMRRLIRDVDAQTWANPETPVLILPKPRNGLEVATLDAFRRMHEANTGKRPQIEHSAPPTPAKTRAKRRPARTKTRSPRGPKKRD